MILVAGCGSLGCEFAKRLKQRPASFIKSLLFVDFDRFEVHNEANETLAQASRYKCEVLAEFLAEVYKTHCLVAPVQDIKNPQDFDMVFSLADSVDAREFCIRNCHTVVDVGVSANQFSVRCYGKDNSAFVDLFSTAIPHSCMVTQISTPDDLVRSVAGGLESCDDIVRACRRENAILGFDFEFTHEFVKQVLRIKTQSSCICQLSVRRALLRAEHMFSGERVADVLIGTFSPMYNEQEYDLDVPEEDAQRVVVYQGMIIHWPEIGILGSPEEISQGSVFFV